MRYDEPNLLQRKPKDCLSTDVELHHVDESRTVPKDVH